MSVCVVFQGIHTVVTVCVFACIINTHIHYESRCMELGVFLCFLQMCLLPYVCEYLDVWSSCRWE